GPRPARSPPRGHPPRQGRPVGPGGRGVLLRPRLPRLPATGPDTPALLEVGGRARDAGGAAHPGPPRPRVGPPGPALGMAALEGRRGAAPPAWRPRRSRPAKGYRRAGAVRRRLPAARRTRPGDRGRRRGGLGRRDGPPARPAARRAPLPLLRPHPALGPDRPP